MAKRTPREDVDLLPAPGERAFVAGMTGSGKTAFVAWLLQRMDSAPVIILDTKEEQKFLALPNSVLVSDIAGLDQAINDESVDYIVLRPPVELANDWEELDAVLLHIYINYTNVVVDIDEAYMVHNSARAGRGLNALMTRGRARGITTILCTQRPAWISKFVITEAQKFYIFYLQTREDKKRIGDIVPGFEDLADPPQFGFHFFRAGEREVTTFGGVKLDKALDTGYTDDPAPPSDSPLSPEVKGRLWL